MKQELKPIEKERIKKLNFLKWDVIKDEGKKAIREQKLKRAELLGNSYKRKAKILFKTVEGLFRVETTVWAKTEKFIALKGGVLIPIHCIDEVDFF